MTLRGGVQSWKETLLRLARAGRKTDEVKPEQAKRREPVTEAEHALWMAMGWKKDD